MATYGALKNTKQKLGWEFLSTHEIVRLAFHMQEKTSMCFFYSTFPTAYI